ncbi:MAG: hypothetical protein HG459_003405 [Bacteroidia bacterium]|jgi:hypothetical protein|nr:hypothetical protein [Bacteroidia bacterium]
MPIGYSKPRKYDTLKQGFAVGLVLPLVVLGVILLAYYVSKGATSFAAYLRFPNVLPRLLSLSTLANGLLFYFALRTERYQLGKGLLGMTIFYALIIFILILAR